MIYRITALRKRKQDRDFVAVGEIKTNPRPD
jgi:hypothetical protein